MEFSHSILTRTQWDWILLLWSFDRTGNWGSERPGDLPEVTQPVGSVTEFEPMSLISIVAFEMYYKWNLLSGVRLFVTPWTVAGQAPLSMEFARQEYWNGLPCPPPEGLPDQEIKPASLMSPAWQAGSLPLTPPGSPSGSSSCYPLFFSRTSVLCLGMGCKSKTREHVAFVSSLRSSYVGIMLSSFSSFS